MPIDIIAMFRFQLKQVNACFDDLHFNECKNSLDANITVFVGINPFLNKPLFIYVCSTSRLKTVWETEKLLNASNSD